MAERYSRGKCTEIGEKPLGLSTCQDSRDQLVPKRRHIQLAQRKTDDTPPLRSKVSSLFKEIRHHSETAWTFIHESDILCMCRSLLHNSESGELILVAH